MLTTNVTNVDVSTQTPKALPATIVVAVIVAPL